jgi:putative spermidine/putrescine transport system ATP-binding protein
MQSELKAIQRDVGITFLYVTHDQEEALTMSDRIAVFNHARIEQVGTPVEVYEHPASEFVAGFVGVSNVLERAGRRFTVRPEKITMHAPGDVTRGYDAEEGVVAEVVYVGAVTRYVVDLDDGGRLTVVSQNVDSFSSRTEDEVGRRVVLAWRPENTFTIDRAIREEEVDA